MITQLSEILTALQHLLHLFPERSVNLAHFTPFKVQYRPLTGLSQRSRAPDNGAFFIAFSFLFFIEQNQSLGVHRLTVYMQLEMQVTSFEAFADSRRAYPADDLA